MIHDYYDMYIQFSAKVPSMQSVTGAHTFECNNAYYSISNYDEDKNKFSFVFLSDDKKHLANLKNIQRSHIVHS